VQEFDSIQHKRFAETLFTHDHRSNRKIKSIIKGIHRDANEFSFRNGESPAVYTQIYIDALTELKEEYE
jgi:hypothetical protein